MAWAFDGDHRLGAFPGVAAPDAVELERGPAPELLDDGKAFFAAERGRADRLAERVDFEGQRVERLALGSGDRGHVVVEAGNGDAEILVVQLGE